MKHFLSLAFLATILTLTGCDETGASNTEFAPELSTQIDTISYLIGYSTGNGMDRQGLTDVNKDVLLGAMNEGLAGEESKIDLQQASMMMRQYMMEKQQEKAQENLKESESWLEENAEKDSVQTTESGLQYKVIEEGNGPKPTMDDRVKVHYHGTLPDGTVFDSSVDKGEPATLRVGGVIKGWQEGIQMMSEGAKYQFFIPPSLGYGERGSGNIEPNSVILFDVELIEIVEEEPAADNEE